MMPCDYQMIAGDRRVVDLDAVIDVALGYSGVRASWTATLVFDPSSGAFIELRSAPQDLRGNSADDAKQVEADYIGKSFGISELQLAAVIRSPRAWTVLDLRTP